MKEKNIFHTIVEKGDSTRVISISYWRAIIYPSLLTSPTMLKEFYVHIFQPHRILTTFPIELQVKTISIEVKVVDAPLEYNFLLGCSWFYVMKVVFSLAFRLLHFPHY